jgi:class 3 adenylate cyclase
MRELIDRNLEQALAGFPRLIIIEGAIGVGKTATADWALSAAADRGAMVLRSCCVEGSVVPFAPVASMFKLIDQLDPNWPDTDGRPSAWSTRPELELLGDVISGLTALSSTQPIAILIDDIQWADPATLRLVEQLLFSLTSASVGGHSLPIMVTVTARTPVTDERASQAISRLQREPIAVTSRLGPLDEREAAALISEHTVATDRTTSHRLWQASGGNPLLLLLLLRAAGDPTSMTPRTLDKALEARFKLLDVRAQQVAAEAAGLGHGSYAWLSAVSALDEQSFSDVVEVLHRADILRFDGDDNFNFTHPYVRHVALASVTRPAQLFLAIAERLDGFLGDPRPEESIELARLWIEARVPAGHAPLVRSAEKGAAYAASIGAWSTAADLIEVLLADPNLADPVAVADYAERAGDAANFDHDPDRCARHMAAAATIARSMGDDRLWGRTVLTSARSRFTLGSAAVGRWIDVAAIEEFLDHAGPDVLDLRARAYGLLAEMAFQAFEMERANTYAHLARSVMAEPPADVEFWLRSAEGFAALGDLRLHDSARLFSEATVAVDQIADAWHRGAPRSRRGVALFGLGDLARSSEDARESSEMNAAAANWAEHAVSESLWALIHFARGDRAAALVASEMAELSYIRSEYAFVPLMVLPAVACAFAYEGRSTDALEALDRLDERGGQTARMRAMVRAIADGKTPEGKPESRAAHNLNSLGAVAASAELADLAGDDATLARTAALLRPLAENGVVLGIGWPHFLPRLVGLGALADGDYPHAREWLSIAQRMAEGHQLLPELARTQVGLARLELAMNGTDGLDRAIELAVTASDTMAALGLQGLHDRMRDTWTHPAVATAVGDPSRTSTSYILFTDIVDSTATTALLGDVRWVMLLAEHDRITRDTVLAHHGRVVKHTGDGFCVSFRSAEDAMGAATTLHRRMRQLRGVLPDQRLRVRCGIAAGATIDYRGDIHGLAVPLAARICAFAGPDETCVSREVRDLAGGVSLIGPFEATLKGIPNVQHIYRLPERLNQSDVSS